MAVYGRLRAKNGESFTEFYPKTYANLVYMQGAVSQTVQSRIADIISGIQKVGSASNADHATNSDNATTAGTATVANTIKLENANNTKCVIRESSYVPAQGNYTNALVFIKRA